MISNCQWKMIVEERHQIVTRLFQLWNIAISIVVHLKAQYECLSYLIKTTCRKTMQINILWVIKVMQKIILPLTFYMWNYLLLVGLIPVNGLPLSLLGVCLLLVGLLLMESNFRFSLGVYCPFIIYVTFNVLTVLQVAF